MGWEKWLLSYHVRLLIYSCGSQTFSFQGPPKHKWDHGPQFDWALSQGPPSEKSFTIRSVCLSICLSVSPSLSIVVVVFITTLFFWGYAFFSISTTNLLNVIIASFMVVSSYRVDKNLPTDIRPDIQANTFWNTSKHFCDHSRTTFSHYDTHTKHTRWSINSWCCHSW